MDAEDRRLLARIALLVVLATLTTWWLAFVAATGLRIFGAVAWGS